MSMVSPDYTPIIRGRAYPRPGDGKRRYKGRGKYQLPSRLTKT